MIDERRDGVDDDTRPIRVIALLVAALGVGVMVTALQYPELPSGRPGPGLFPSIIGGGLAISGVFLFAQTFSSRWTSGAAPARQSRSEKINWALVASAPFGYVLAARMAGTPVVLALIGVVLMARLRVPFVKALVISAIGSTSLWLLFEQLLGVNLP